MLIPKLQMNELIKKSKLIRKEIVEVCVTNGAGHIAPSLSCVDILVALYYQIMNISFNPIWEERDRLVFSKAHGCYGLYAILADIGYIKRKDWLNFYKESHLSGCSERNLEIGIEASCGSLGHGLPIATGIAFGAKLQNKKYKIYCIVGDGEMQEGTNWEALQFAVYHKLSNLIIIIDNNNLQAIDFLENILSYQNSTNDLKQKLEAFGLNVKICNGHDLNELCNTINEVNNSNVLIPSAIIAKTIKGYGLKCMENIPKFHFRLPTLEELKEGNRYE